MPEPIKNITPSEEQARIDAVIANVRKRTRPAPKPVDLPKNLEVQQPPAGDVSGSGLGKSKSGKPVTGKPKLDRRSRKTSADKDYEVGYGRPPVKTQFQPGQCGNPRGRPKATRNVNSIIKDSVFKVREATIDGKKKRMTQFEIGIHQLMNKFMTGDAKASAQVLALLTKMQELGNSAKGEEAGSAALPVLTDSGRRMIARHQSDLYREAGLSEEQIDTLLANLGLPAPEQNTADDGPPDDQYDADTDGDPGDDSHDDGDEGDDDNDIV